MADVLTELVAKITTDASELKRGLAEAEGAAQKASKSIQQSFKDIGTKATDIGKQLSMKLTAPIVGLGSIAFKMAGDFDQSFRKVNVMLGASTEEAKEYKKRILEISSATGKSAGEVVDAWYLIVSAGYRGADSLDLLDVAVRGATGGAADAILTTEALTKAMNVFELEGVEGSSKAMDIFFGIVDSGLLTFEQMANSFPRAASNAAGLGISVEETGATLATLTKVLGSTEQAATATDAVFRLLISPSEAMAKLYEKWGVKSGPEAIEKFGSLTGVLAELKDETGGEVTAIRELFASDEAMKGILPLLTSSYDDYGEAIDTVTNSQGRANEAFDEMAQGPGFQLQQTFTQIKNAGIKLGDTLASTLIPLLKTLGEKVEGLIAWWQSLDERWQKVIIVAFGILAVVGPMLIIFGQMAIAISFLIPVVSALAVAIMGVTWPVLAVIAGLAALIAIGILVWKNWDTIKEKTVSIWDSIVGFLKGVWDNIVDFFGENWDKILAILFPAIGLPILIARNWGSIVEVIKDIWNRVINWLKEVPGRIGEAFVPIKDFILAPFRSAWEGIETGLNWLIRMLNSISFTIPDWVPIIGGKFFGINIAEVSLPSFATGGIVTQPTLAMIGEAGPEAVVPLNEMGMGGITINFTQPVFFDREDTMNKFVDMISKGIDRKQRLRFGGAYSG